MSGNSARDALCGYLALRRESDNHDQHQIPGTKTAMAVLARYASAWESVSAFDPEDWEPSDDAVDSTRKDLLFPSSTRVRYTPVIQPDGDGPWNHIRRLASFPLLARLNYVKQLSTTNIGLNIGATHNRLAHLLGTMDVAARLLQVTCARTPEDALPTLPEVVAVLLYALLHDLYHGPLGHSLDRIGDLTFPNQGETRVDKALLKQNIELAAEERGDMWPLILRVAGWIHTDADKKNWHIRIRGPRDFVDASSLATDIRDFLESLASSKYHLAQSDPDRFWLREIVDGPLDADRLDYLLRDTEALHYTNRPSIESIRDLVDRAAVVDAELAMPENDANGEPVRLSVKRIHWDVSSKSLVEELDGLRARLYATVYETPEKRVFDEMLTHGLVWILGEETKEALPETLRRIAAISDDELFHFLYEIGTKPQHRIGLGLIHDVAVGRPFREVCRIGIESAQLASARERREVIATQISEVVNRLLRQTAKERGVDPETLPKPAATVLVPELLRVLPGDPKNFWGLVYQLESRAGRSFQDRRCIEQMLWEQLLLADNDRELANIIDNSLNEIMLGLHWSCTGAPTTQEAKALLSKYPLLFCSVPWISVSAADVRKMNWEPHEPHVYHRSMTREPIMHDPAERKHEMFYPISVYLPQRLAAIKAVRQLAGRLITRLIYSLVWYSPQEIKEAGIPWWETPIPEGHQDTWVRLG